MNKKSLVAFVLFAVISASGIILAGASVLSITAKSDGNNVTVEWRTSTEENVESFIVERKTVNGSFSYLTTIEPKGSNSYYSYVDDSAYKTSGELFVYRLKIVDKDKSVSNLLVSVNHDVSSVKRTWGSIKAMFR